ncbi:peptidylprolyl isomerase, partial [Vibrio vulnificus]|uniref:peptidylprolyl isomerase n=1 Tax=Vibrio vulnificus TaxID=672 RepID=UPI0030EE5AB8
PPPPPPPPHALLASLGNFPRLRPPPSFSGHPVFGQVTEGFDVIQQMASKPTKSQGYMRDIPVEPIVITKATLLP